jgi:uncharacterized repeat protein (TIGR03833 family)
MHRAKQIGSMDKISDYNSVNERKVTQMPVPKRIEIHPQMRVQIIEKQNQGSGKLTEGVVARILTSSPTHPHGIKVMLTDGKVGRVQAIVKPNE